MAVLEILSYPDKRLKIKADDVSEVDERIKTLVRDMAETMYAAPGVGLAATQVGVSQQVAVIDIEWSNEGGKPKLITLINPEILSHRGESREKEGCLSLPGFYEEVSRFAELRFRALDIDGKPYEMDCRGLMAIAVQHEVDHLNGILAVDRVSPLKRNIYRSKLKKWMREGTLPDGVEEAGQVSI